MIWLASVIPPVIAALLFSLVWGEFNGRMRARALELTGDDAKNFRKSMRALAFVVLPAAALGFWISLNGEAVGLSSSAKMILFFAIWLGGANALILFANRIPFIGRFTEPAGTDVRGQYYGGLFNK